MCKTYDCMGIALAIVVIIDLWRFTYVDRTAPPLWKLLRELFQPPVLAPGAARLESDPFGDTSDPLGYSLVPHVQHTLFPQPDFALAGGLGGPGEHPEDQGAARGHEPGSRQVLQEV